MTILIVVLKYVSYFRDFELEESCPKTMRYQSIIRQNFHPRDSKHTKWLNLRMMTRPIVDRKYVSSFAVLSGWEPIIDNETSEHHLPKVYSSGFHCDWCILQRWFTVAFETNATCEAQFAMEVPMGVESGYHWTVEMGMPLAWQHTIHSSAEIYDRKSGLCASTIHLTEQTYPLQTTFLSSHWKWEGSVRDDEWTRNDCDIKNQ